MRNFLKTLAIRGITHCIRGRFAACQAKELKMADLPIWLLLLYFLPVFVAASRKHKNTSPIAVITLFLGWTGLMWVIALAWALSDNVAKPEKISDSDLPAKSFKDQAKKTIFGSLAALLVLVVLFSIPRMMLNMISQPNKTVSATKSSDGVGKDGTGDTKK
jgi:uncharacterized membrane protein